jgi:hypothetical protein
MVFNLLMTGLEPAIPGLEDRCVIHLRYMSGSVTGNRTRISWVKAKYYTIRLLRMWFYPDSNRG